MEPQLAPRHTFDSTTLEAHQRDDSMLREEYAAREAWGLLASIDLHACDPELIRNPEAIREFIHTLCARIDMVRHGECHIERFGDGTLEGYSVFQFIETSCVSAHFDEKLTNATYLDIFSCKYFNPFEASEYAKEFFKAADYTLSYTLRK